jgi:uncharacterized integral membrane protein (TIGR00698 family)
MTMTPPASKLTWIPGVLLTAAIAALGLQSSIWLGEGLLQFEKTPISGIMMAILFGLLVGNLVPLPTWVRPGIHVSMKWLLRLGIVLLGIRLSLGDVLRLGALGIPLILLCVTGGIAASVWLGQRLHLSQRMSVLIAVGTSICGATAIVATGPAIEAREEELTYAVANVTVFGILAMLLYPLLAHLLFSNDPTSAGLFLGTSIHETAQVAGSGLIYDQLYNEEEALEAATVTKLVRNLLMVLVVPLMAYQYQKNNQSQQKISFLKLFPVFILGFLLMALLRTIGDASLEETGQAWWSLSSADWKSLTDSIKQSAEILLAIAMAAVGLGTSLQQLRNLGIQPFYVGLMAATTVGILSLGGIELLRLLNLT